MQMHGCSSELFAEENVSPAKGTFSYYIKLPLGEINKNQFVFIELAMARESQPPPSLLVQDLEEKLQSAQQRHSSLEAEYNYLAEEFESSQSALARVTAELAEANELLKDKEGEIKYLQNQLEEVVNEVVQLKERQQVPKRTTLETPIKLVQDMKDRLKVILFYFIYSRTLKKKSAALNCR